MTASIPAWPSEPSARSAQVLSVVVPMSKATPKSRPEVSSASTAIT